VKKHGKIDGNQHEIVKFLRACGYSVVSCANMGAGFPDLIAGKHGVNYLIEVKNGRGKLTKQQVVWHDDWRGQVVVIRNLEELQAWITENY
jgi:Holliday junction resolvase